jgi:hypothetical protein
MDEFPNPRHDASNSSSKNSISKIFLGAIVLLIIVGGSFYGGTRYEKSHVSSSKAVSATSSTGGFGGGIGGSGYASRSAYTSLGSVTAISSSSISVQDERSGTVKTYSITSSTVITDNGSTVTYSDIQNSDGVIVMASSSAPTTASRINVNPSYGGNNPSTGSQTTQTTQGT